MVLPIYKFLHTAYRLGYDRVGCWCCPNNNQRAQFLSRIYMPEQSKKWRDFLIDFAKKVGKKDAEVYLLYRLLITLVIGPVLNIEQHHLINLAGGPISSQTSINTCSSFFAKRKDADAIRKKLNEHQETNSYKYFNEHINTFITANANRLNYLKTDFVFFPHIGQIPLSI